MSASSLYITATFTAEPLETVLAFWNEQCNLDATVAFAPFGQVNQALLDPASPAFALGDGLNVVLVRMEDLGARGHAAATPGAAREAVSELLAAAAEAARRASRPILIVSCPASPAAPAELAALDAVLAEACERTPGLYFLGPEEILARYPSDDYHDVYGAREGQIPYTELGFAAIATMIIRRFLAIRRSRTIKVIVLDCDQTLWKGVVGEDGVEGIVLDEGRVSLQRFMAEQKARNGVLLAMCSKNNEADVLEVFDVRRDMVLKREDFVAWRINWQPKSMNLRALAKELELGLDTFVFVDDDPVQCAEVRAATPDVLVIELPADPASIAEALGETWELDRAKATEEDRRRTEMYAQNREREALRTSSFSLEDYLASLALEVAIAAPTPEQLSRVAQLTQRTNQFNLGNLRRSEAELRDCGRAILAVSVRDRFGDYGLVGAVVFVPVADVLEVDTFLLSCRALGRRVEHAMLARLEMEARQRGIARVGLRFRSTPKNAPAAAFLAACGAERAAVLDEGAELHVLSVRPSA